MLRRDRRAEAMDFYERARKQVASGSPIQDVLTRQIERLSSNEPLEQIRDQKHAC